MYVYASAYDRKREKKRRPVTVSDWYKQYRKFSVVASQLGGRGRGFRGGVLQLWYQSGDRIPAGI